MAHPALLGPGSGAAPLFLPKWFQKSPGGICCAPSSLPREVHPQPCFSRTLPRYLLMLGSPGWSPNPRGSSQTMGPHPVSRLTAPLCSAGEGRLEVRGHGDRPHLPLDVHHRLPAGHRGAVPPALPGGDDLGTRLWWGRWAVQGPSSWGAGTVEPMSRQTSPLPGRTQFKPWRTLGCQMQGGARAVRQVTWGRCGGTAPCPPARGGLGCPSIEEGMGQLPHCLSTAWRHLGEVSASLSCCKSHSNPKSHVSNVLGNLTGALGRILTAGCSGPRAGTAEHDMGQVIMLWMVHAEGCELVVPARLHGLGVSTLQSPAQT